jgi:hypothetical protein
LPEPALGIPLTKALLGSGAMRFGTSAPGPEKLAPRQPDRARRLSRQYLKHAAV